MARKTCFECRHLRTVPLRCGNRYARPTLAPNGDLICRWHEPKPDADQVVQITPPDTHPPTPQKGQTEP
jgi:hypothetical protein